MKGRQNNNSLTAEETPEAARIPTSKMVLCGAVFATGVQETFAELMGGRLRCVLVATHCLLSQRVDDLPRFNLC